MLSSKPSFKLPIDAIITQGFIANNKKGETVLLGRGGSDTSAAYFATKLNASSCEIWTDVSGMYTANPHVIPEARLLNKLNYAEAQEISSAGAKVLHPNSINPLRERAIPLYIKNLRDPKKEYEEVLNFGINVGVDNIYPLQNWTEIFADKDIIIRIDPGYSESKFGIPMSKLEVVAKITKENNVNVIGLHSHCGSGILQSETW